MTSKMNYSSLPGRNPHKKVKNGDDPVQSSKVAFLQWDYVDSESLRNPLEISFQKNFLERTSSRSTDDQDIKLPQDSNDLLKKLESLCNEINLNQTPSYKPPSDSSFSSWNHPSASLINQAIEIATSRKGICFSEYCESINTSIEFM